mmetsp:Transcript_12393/g.15812  ORF Transcript_12393/g.15812 Transcript_12393/m.15812 type:complete len:312 (+) Transcript_12393:265-1200(+)
MDEASLRTFIEQSDIRIKKLDDEEIIFDLIGAEPPLANALRRILIAEIPTMAIEKVEMWQNTSIIPDENLAHRVGLIPLAVDPRLFEFKTSAAKPYDATNSLRFKLHVTCTKKNPGEKVQVRNAHEEDLHYNNASVYSGDLEWVPIGDQQERFETEGIPAPKPLHDDILIAKLRPGQEIEMELVCEKGIGRTHAKWSPVCTAFYRNLPDIRFTEQIVNEDAEELKKVCPMGVFDIEDLGKKGKRAVVKDGGVACTTCRECIRDERFASRVDLGKKKEEFEFHVESVGIYTPDELVIEALAKLKEKAVFWYD